MHLSTTIEGAHAIRAFGKNQDFIEEFHDYLDKQTAAWTLLIATYCWVSQKVDTLVSIIILASVIAGLVVPGKVEFLTAQFQFVYLWLNCGNI